MPSLVSPFCMTVRRCYISFLDHFFQMLHTVVGACIFYVLILQERHKILEEMGISVQDSGIGVKEGRYFLVNLNADPSLNELLVYYLKVCTTIIHY